MSTPPTRAQRALLVAGALFLTLTSASCSSSSSSSSSSASSPTTVPTSTSTTLGATPGLCDLVGTSEVATLVSTNMQPQPVSHVQGASTQCLYRSKENAKAAILIRYDTDSSGAIFAQDRATFERGGQKVGQVNGVGDEGFYFTSTVGQASLNTVAVRQGSLQILVTGTGSLGQIGAITRHALTAYDSQTGAATSTTAASTATQG